MNQQMSLQEYKKKAEEYLMKLYPGTTPKDAELWSSTTSNGWWEQYMEDFSPETAVQGIVAGLI
ncbi:MAG: hypothetical protein IKS68_04210 [Mailhella sp.]|nr:hypothetical protein [Mailhella sp.]